MSEAPVSVKFSIDVTVARAALERAWHASSTLVDAPEPGKTPVFPLVRHSHDARVSPGTETGAALRKQPAPWPTTPPKDCVDNVAVVRKADQAYWWLDAVRERSQAGDR